MASFSSVRQQVYDTVSRSQYYRDNLSGLTAQERHQQLVNAALSYQHPTAAGTLGQQQNRTRTDTDVLRERHRFIRSADDDAEDSWEVRLARRYYSRLFKEYAIADLSRYKDKQIGFRWRTEPEVVSGKGQFVCGAKGCPEHAGLASFEVNFAYQEAGQHKQALVKLRLCPSCAAKLNYHRDKQYRRLDKRRMELDEEQQERERKRLRRLQRAAEASVAAPRQQAQQQHQQHPASAPDRPHDAAGRHASEARGDRLPASSKGRGGSRTIQGGVEQQQQQQQQGRQGQQVTGEEHVQQAPTINLTDAEIEQFLDEVFT